MGVFKGTRSERGASIVELALIAPVMVLLVYGVTDLARGYDLQIELENAAREGAMYAQIAPNDVVCAGRDDITERVQDEKEGIVTVNSFEVKVWTEDAGGNMTVPVTGCGGTTVQSGDRVRVEVKGVFDVLTPPIERIAGPVIYITRKADVVAQ